MRTRLRTIFAFGAAVLLTFQSTWSAETLPPLLTTSAATTLDPTGRPWAYVTLGENRPGLIAGHHLVVYSRFGSGASFVMRGPINGTQDPAAVGVMLVRGASLGDNLGALESQLLTLHAWLLSTPGQPPATAPPMSLAQRVAALQARAAGDTRLGSLLDLYGLSHPALRLIRGTAWAGRLDTPVGTPVTLEVRETDAADREFAVIGRVTLAAGLPEVLPAPGPIVIVPDVTGQSDLSVKLRWATPDALRQASTRHHGDVAWRVARSVAEANAFNTVPPSARALDQLAVSNPNNVRRLAGPIFPTRLFDALSVADFNADRTNSFLLDDNDRNAIGGLPFAEGAQFYYFVAAADVLGRPGTVSPGLLATMCRQVPPPVPLGLKAVVHWDATNGQYWDISWKSNPAGAGTPTSGYEVYRGYDFAQLTAAQRGGLDLSANPIIPGNPTAIQRIAVIPDPGAGSAQVLHTTLAGDGSFGRMWWFAIRAIHSGPSPCGDLASALSPPALSSLLNNATPVSPDPATQLKPVTDCLRIGCAVDQSPAPEAVSQTLDPSTVYYVARCRRLLGLSAAHFRVTTVDTAESILPDTIAVFAPDDDMVEVSWTLPLARVSSPLMVECQGEALGNYQGLWVSSLAAGVAPSTGQQMVFHFVGAALAESERGALALNDPLYRLFFGLHPGDCSQNWTPGTHLVVSPGTGQILHPQFTIPLGVGAKQYRFYRRLENGAMTLIGQGLQDYAGPGSGVSVVDSHPPVSNGAVDYFSQFLDENGIASTLHRLVHLNFTGDTPPTPVLLTPIASDYGGTLSAPTVTLTWVDAPEHVERFEIFLAADKSSTDPDPHIQGVANLLTTRVSPQPVVWKLRSRLDYSEQNLITLPRSYLTGRVGNDYQPGPRFTFTVQVDPALKYHVWLRALGPGGEPSGQSRLIDVQWQPPAAPPANIAWPARPLPPVASFNSGIQIIDFSALPDSRLIWSVPRGIGIPYRPVDPDSTPVGIRVGSIPVDDNSTFAHITTAPAGPYFFAPGDSKSAGRADPNLQLFSREGDATQKLLPCVLYRQQVPNDRFPSVSGDVIQCSPLIRSIAWISQRINAADVGGELVDPLFRWIHPDFQATAPQLDLYLVDTQPVVQAARYHYWLVRFSDLGEPIQTVPCGEVTVNTP